MATGVGFFKVPWLQLLIDKELSHGWLHGIPLNVSAPFFPPSSFAPSFLPRDHLSSVTMWD